MKNFLKALFGLIALLVIAAFVLLSRVNTDGNKQAIQAAVLDATGYEMTIGGDLSLDIFPTFGLSLNDVRLRNPAYPQELASTSQVVLRVELAPLVNRQLAVQEMLADDFHINYFINADGNSIWEVDDSATGSSSGFDPSANAASEIGTNTIPDLSIERIRINNASIDFQDQAQGSRFRIDQLNLDSSNTNLTGQPFAIDLGFDYENNGMSAAVPMNLHADVSANLESGLVSFDNLQISVTPMLVTGNVTLENFNDAPGYSGTLQANGFDVMGLLQSLGFMEIETEPQLGIATDTQLAFNLDFSGDNNQASLSSFNIDFAGAAISGDANVRMATDFSPMSASYNINAGNLDLSPFFPEPQATESVANDSEPPIAVTGNPAAQYQAETELPIELINSMTLLGATSIESIIVGDIRLEDINVFTNIEDGVVDIEIPPLSAFEGTAQAALRLDARSADPTLTLSSTVADINLLNLAPSLSRFNTVTGFLQAESNYSATGITASELSASLSGNTAFSITENSVDIGVIKQVFTAIAALSPTGEAIQQWPDVIQFTEMAGFHVLEQGFLENQQLQLRMDNFDISGTGGFDLDAGTFAYDLGFAVLGEPTIQTIPINELYHNVTWPVDCSGAFSDDVNRYCRPDFTRVREIFTQIGSNALRNQLQETITDQVPEDLQDAARGLLRSILN